MIEIVNSMIADHLSLSLNLLVASVKGQELQFSKLGWRNTTNLFDHLDSCIKSLSVESLESECICHRTEVDSELCCAESWSIVAQSLVSDNPIAIAINCSECHWNASRRHSTHSASAQSVRTSWSNLCVHFLRVHIGPICVLCMYI